MQQMSKSISAIPSGIGRDEAFSFLHAVLAQIEAENKITNGLISISRVEAEKDLQRVLAARVAKSPLPLDGRLFVVKDNIDVGGVPGTLGSDHLSNRIPEFDSDVVKKFREAGAVLVGMANMHELAFGATSENPHFGTVRNPWDSNRNAGGSSGGSAVSVAIGWVDFSLGTDTGGSVRCPAAISGISGLRPTFGLVSTEGVYPLAESFDTVGFFSRKAFDLELLLDIAVGHATATQETQLPKLKIGIPTNPYFSEGVDPGVLAAIREMSRVLEIAGIATFVKIEVPDPEQSDYVSRMIVHAEAWQVYGKQSEQNPNGFGENVISRLQSAKTISPAEVQNLLRERHKIAADLDALFESVDLILLPTVPQAPRPIGLIDPLQSTERNLAFTYLWGLAGLPGLSVPCGFEEGLPIGAQLIGPRNSDRVLCRVGSRYQELTDWHLQKPFKISTFEPTMLVESTLDDRKKT
jgi:aspartyl-tRNA(Asn)/glutamyl-tRNA(Gln) amidotransferase subunit A